MVLLREPPTYDLRRVRGPHRVRRVQELLRCAPASGPFRILIGDDPQDAAHVAEMFALLRASEFSYDVRRTPAGLHEITIERRQSLVTGNGAVPEEQNERVDEEEDERPLPNEREQCV
jgi:hypothetical protein